MRHICKASNAYRVSICYHNVRCITNPWTIRPGKLIHGRGNKGLCSNRPIIHNKQKTYFRRQPLRESIWYSVGSSTKKRGIQTSWRMMWPASRNRTPCAMPSCMSVPSETLARYLKTYVLIRSVPGCASYYKHALNRITPYPGLHVHFCKLIFQGKRAGRIGHSEYHTPLFPRVVRLPLPFFSVVQPMG